MVVLVVMCRRRLTHCGVGGVLGRWFGHGSGGFLRLLPFGSIGWLAMCQWRLAHCGVDGGFGGYASVAAGT